MALVDLLTSSSMEIARIPLGACSLVTVKMWLSILFSVQSFPPWVAQRDELLDGEIFSSLKETQILIESWRRHYVRPLESHRCFSGGQGLHRGTRLSRVTAYFRRKVAERSGKHVFVCDTDPSKALIKSTRAKIDHDVQEVRSMCRSCLLIERNGRSSSPLCANQCQVLQKEHE